MKGKSSDLVFILQSPNYCNYLTGENSFFWRGSRNYHYNNIITNDDSQWERKLSWVSYQILFSPPHLLLTNSLKVWEDFFLPVFTIFRSCWLLVNCFALVLNLYLMIEASSGVLWYTLLSAPRFSLWWLEINYGRSIYTMKINTLMLFFFPGELIYQHTTD